MAKEPKIEPVDNTYDKRNTYQHLICQYRKAMAKGFYGEAELIVYAFLEDRLRSFLYHIDAIDRRNSRGINENMEVIFGECKNIDSINTKLDIIEKTLKLVNKNDIKSEYSKELARLYHIGLNVSDFRSTIKKIRKWTGYRNEIVHAMFNKNIDALRAGYKEHVEEGFSYARYIDQQVENISKA